jgi:hypothetical protein
MSHGSPLSGQALSLQQMKFRCSSLPVTFVPVALIACGLLSGCISYQYTSYPYQWPKLVAERIGDCPTISGRYNNQASEITKIPSSGKQLSAARADASPSLVSNLAGSYSELQEFCKWVDIKQADENTIAISLGGWLAESEPVQHVLRRDKGDFWCEDGKVYISGPSESWAKGKTEGTTMLMTTLGIGVGTGGVRLQRGAFSQTMKGDLVMEAQRSAVGVVLFYFPNISAQTYYLRWTPYLPLEPAPADVR